MPTLTQNRSKTGPLSSTLSFSTKGTDSAPATPRKKVHTTGPGYQGSIITPSKSIKKLTKATPGSMKKTPSTRVVNDENKVNDTNKVVREAPGKLVLSSTSQDVNDNQHHVNSPMNFIPRGQGIFVQEPAFSKSVTAAAAIVNDNVVAGNRSDSDGITAMVSEALDVMLRDSEIDDRIHRRLSTQAFNPAALRRLSMAEFPQKCFSVDDVDMIDYSSATSASRPSVDSQASGQGSSFNLKQSDVLSALRAYITALDTDTVMLDTIILEPVAEDAIEHEVLHDEIDDIEITKQLLDILDKEEDVVTDEAHTVVTVTDNRLSQSSARISMSSISAVSSKPTRLTQYPMQNILAPALEQHRVAATIRDWVVWNDHVKYQLLVELQHIDASNPEAISPADASLMLLRRYTDFEKLYNTLQNLSTKLSKSQQAEMQSMLPSFPGKQIINWLPYCYASPSFLSYRQQGLQTWINGLLANHVDIATQLRGITEVDMPDAETIYELALKEFLFN